MSAIYRGPGITEEHRYDCRIPLVKQLFDFILMRGPMPDFGGQELHKIFVEHDKAHSGEFRNLIRQELIACARGDHRLKERHIGHLIALIPYTYPEVGEIFSIPVHTAAGWSIVEYRIDTMIELTPGFFSTPLPAYGLVPLHDATKPPILAFLGSTYPAGQGFIASWLSDCSPFFSVGHGAYLWGESKIKAWLRGKENVYLAGISLGGALCYQTARHQLHKFSKIFVYNPPGLYSWNLNDVAFDNVKTSITLNQNDLVSEMGHLPTGKGVEIFEVSVGKKENFVKAHNAVFTGASKHIHVRKLDPEKENSKMSRIALTILHFVLSPFIFAAIIAFYVIFNLIKFIVFFVSYPFKEDSPPCNN